MKYLVIKMYKDGTSFVEKPNKPLSLDEATALRNMLARTDADCMYYVVELPVEPLFTHA